VNFTTSRLLTPSILLVTPALWLTLALPVCRAETEETLDKTFAASAGGRLVVDVDFGAIEISTNATSEVTVHVWRKVSRKDKTEEEEFLRERPVTFSQDGNTLTVRSQRGNKRAPFWRGPQRTDAKYTIAVPAQFSAQLKTAGGGITVSDLTGTVNAHTSGGSLKFTHLHGPLDGQTSGGGVAVAGCEGTLKVNTSGGAIEVAAGSGTLTGETSGGPIRVKSFRGPARVQTSGGRITLEDVGGAVEGSTSGGAISALFHEPLADSVKLETSGGGVTLQVPEKSAFDLDAVTTGGGVSSDLPVIPGGKPARNRLQGAVNGGGKAVTLRTSGGRIEVKTL